MAFHRKFVCESELKRFSFHVGGYQSVSRGPRKKENRKDVLISLSWGWDILSPSSLDIRTPGFLALGFQDIYIYILVATLGSQAFEALDQELYSITFSGSEAFDLSRAMLPASCSLQLACRLLRLLSVFCVS